MSYSKKGKKECTFEDAIRCLTRVFARSEYFAVNKDASKLDKRELKRRVEKFIDAELERIFKILRKGGK